PAAARRPPSPPAPPRSVRGAAGGARPPPAPSYVGERSWPAVPWKLSEGEPLRLTTADLGVELTGEPARLSFLDAAGQWLLREPAHRGVGGEPAGGPRRGPPRLGVSGGGTTSRPGQGRAGVHPHRP